MLEGAVSVLATHSDTEPPVWRAPEGLVGLAAVHVGGGGVRATREHNKRHWCGGRRRDRRARAGFEARRRTK